MKICPQCREIFFEETAVCPICKVLFQEKTLQEIFKETKQAAFQKFISGTSESELPDPYKHYNICCYLKNNSLFLNFDIYKNRLKHGRRLSQFFIAPVNIAMIVNFPWFLFNALNTLSFHADYTQYCPRCDSKYIKGYHDLQECEYNIEYFQILEDILSGLILERRAIYEALYRVKKRKGYRSAYQDLFCRRARLEGFWDFISIGSTIAFWIYIAVYVSWPMFNVLIQTLDT